MWRRRMLMYLAGLVTLLVVASGGAIWMLGGVFQALDRTDKEETTVVEVSYRMGMEINAIDLELRAIQIGQSRHLDRLIEQIEALQADATEFGAQYAGLIPDARPLYGRITKNLAMFEQDVGNLATQQDERLARPRLEAALAAAVALRQDIQTVGQLVHEHAAWERRVVIGRFRAVVVAVTVVFLVVIVVSALMMRRLGRMVLRPVEQLVEASRRLGREEYDYRVTIGTPDEFGELAAAYNRLAEQLQANERRKLETLGQAAVTLNHELNNAGAIIKLQLQLLERQNVGTPQSARALVQIHESVARMTVALERLKNVRRIVLADYGEGTKMLDLEKSSAEEPVPT